MTTSEDLPLEVRAAIINDRIEQYRRILFGLEVDAEVAKVVGDEQLLEAVKKRLAATIGGIKALTDMLDKLK